ncbi:MAG: cysteine desulfurase-like protein [Planctomyces sp.]|nr:cysteine desulfurase-like protein [Planctomyces sp.]
MAGWPVENLRRQFPGLRRLQDGRAVALFDGPAGSQVPETVIQAVSRYLSDYNCNRGAAFATARESDEILENAHRVLADFLGTKDSGEVIFGANMTTLTLAASRAISREWQPGDEVIVTRLDHDANVTPWELAAADRGAVIRRIELNRDDWTLNLDQFKSLLNERTRLVAVGYASNATGTINPLTEIIAASHAAEALVYVDAVHYAPHGRINVERLNCDFLACSAYKFFGPHVGILWGRREHLERIRPYKLRPAPEQLPGRWMTGTQSHECIAGAAAAVEYLASLDQTGTETGGDSRSAKLDRVFGRMRVYEEDLSRQLLEGLQEIPEVTIHGIRDLGQLARRVPTVSITWKGKTPREVAEYAAEQGVYIWNGNHYALPFTETAGLEPLGTIRVGALHYNTSEEIDRLLGILRKLSASRGC